MKDIFKILYKRIKKLKITLSIFFIIILFNSNFYKNFLHISKIHLIILLMYSKNSKSKLKSYFVLKDNQFSL